MTKKRSFDDTEQPCDRLPQTPAAHPAHHIKTPSSPAQPSPDRDLCTSYPFDPARLRPHAKLLHRPLTSVPLLLADEHHRRPAPRTKERSGKRDVYIARSTNFPASRKRVYKLIEASDEPVHLHALGAAMSRCCDLALAIEQDFGKRVVLSVQTGTAPVVDEYQPLKEVSSGHQHTSFSFLGCLVWHVSSPGVHCISWHFLTLMTTCTGSALPCDRSYRMSPSRGIPRRYKSLFDVGTTSFKLTSASKFVHRRQRVYLSINPCDRDNRDCSAMMCLQLSGI